MSIYSSHYKWPFTPGVGNELTLGFEYENDNDRDGDSALEPKIPEAWGCEHETFGYSDGWEIKSEVAPLRLIRPKVKQFLTDNEFNESFQDASRYDNDGGIHVNISRTEFTESHHEKVFAFLHNTTHYNFFKKLAHRSDYHFGTYAPQYTDLNKKHYDWGSRSDTVKAAYYGIITARKPYAFELRMFSAHPTLLMPALEFADSLFNYASRIDTAVDLDGWVSFINRRFQYQNIARKVNETLGHSAQGNAHNTAAAA